MRFFLRFSGRGYKGSVTAVTLLIPYFYWRRIEHALISYYMSTTFVLMRYYSCIEWPLSLHCLKHVVYWREQWRSAQNCQARQICYISNGGGYNKKEDIYRDTISNRSITISLFLIRKNIKMRQRRNVSKLQALGLNMWILWKNMILSIS